LFNTTTGEISGTPSATAASAIYTITATNPGGFTATTLTISLTQVAPSGLSYSPSNISGTVGTAIANVNPAVAGTVSSYAIDPALPPGLLFNTTTGEISGTPSAVSPSAMYTVTANNSGGFATTTVTLVVAPNYSSSFGGTSGTELGVDGMPNLLRYAMGASSVSASVVKPVSLLDANNLIITAIVRINDPKVVIVGESSADLLSWNTASTIAGVPASDQTGATPGETQRQSFSVSRGASKIFLRLKAIQQN
jgi:uncharacterized repeat protein (TIGR01451 family)